MVASREPAVIDYATLKQTHVASVVLSGALFAARGVWRFTHPHARFARAARVVPPLIDTVLLLSALGLGFVWLRSGLPLGWIGTKIALLAAYIVLGLVALRPGLRAGPRALAFAASALAFACIVGVALTKSSAGPLRWLLPS